MGVGRLHKTAEGGQGDPCLVCVGWMVLFSTLFMGILWNCIMSLEWLLFAKQKSEELGSPLSRRIGIMGASISERTGGTCMDGLAFKKKHVLIGGLGG